MATSSSHSRSWYALRYLSSADVYTLQPQQISHARFRTENLGSYEGYVHCTEGISLAYPGPECLIPGPSLADFQMVVRKAPDWAARGQCDTLGTGKTPGVRIPHSGAFACRTSSKS